MLEQLFPAPAYILKGPDCIAGAGECAGERGPEPEVENAERMPKTDLVEVLLQLLGPQQQQSLSFNELAGLVGLVDLLGILNLLNGNVGVPARSGNAIQEALNAVLGQAGSGNLKPPAELAGLLGKNPALLTSLMNLLMSARENKAAREKEAPEESPPREEEEPPPQHGRGGRFRNS
ncbi:MAG: hypothetical protein PWP70_979 [Moorella sp. (in: firmicutes)]|nr:hypothetical protein [Moorella sp. (in: firmicutes)]